MNFRVPDCLLIVLFVLYESSVYANYLQTGVVFQHFKVVEKSSSVTFL